MNSFETQNVSGCLRLTAKVGNKIHLSPLISVPVLDLWIQALFSMPKLIRLILKTLDDHLCSIKTSKKCMSLMKIQTCLNVSFFSSLV